MKKLIIFAFILSLFVTNATSQTPVLGTRPSQKAKVLQRIGTTDIEINYHSPLAKGRQVFGGIVPYDLVIDGKLHPWRAGANENTVISFAHDVQINGQALPAGKYGLFIFVSKEEWTFAFSKRSTDWGNFSYKEDEDALRVTTKPEKINHQEWLSYQFENPQPSTVMASISWGNQKAGFSISTNVDVNIMADIEKTETKTWPLLLLASRYTLKLDSNKVTKALEYVDASLALEEHFTNRKLKSQILKLTGKKREGDKLIEKALSEGTANDIFSYAMELNNAGKEEASLEILRFNLEKHPEHWFTYLGYANFYRSKKEHKKAAEYFEKAVKFVPEQGKGFAIFQRELNKSMIKK